MTSVPAFAAVSTPASDESHTTGAAAESLGFHRYDRLPTVESNVISQMPVGGGSVAVPNVDDGAALLRISIFDAKKDTNVMVAGGLALSVDQGTDASTTVLVPVEGNNAPIYADAEANARVEVLASFESDPATPGSIVALDQVATRVDTNAGLGIAALSEDAQEVSVIGLGGVPSEGVRAVFSTIDVNLTSAGQVIVGDQTFTLPGGRSQVTTVTAVDQDGMVPISSTTTGTLRLDVRGSVVGSGQGADAANVEGGFVPATAAKWNSGEATEDQSATLAIGEYSDRVASLVLASATTSGTSSAFVSVGRDLYGRSQGMLVDSAQGALPQIQVVGTGEQSQKVSVRGGSTNVNVLSLGDVVGERIDKQGSAEISVELPESGDLAETGTIQLHGEVSSDASIDRVDVFGNDALIGTAAITYGPSGAEWQLQTGAPESGIVEFRAKVYTRDGASADGEATLEVRLPSPDEVVISPDTVVVNADDISTISDGRVIFTNDPHLKPGDVLVADASDAHPEGALLRVLSVQFTESGWEIGTEQAALTDAIMQAQVQDGQSVLGDGVQVEAPQTDNDFEVVDEGVNNLDLVDQELNPDGIQWIDDSGTSVESTSSQPPESLDMRSFRGSDASLSSERVLKGSAKLAFTTDYSKDLSKATQATKQAEDAKLKAEGGLSVEATVTLTLGTYMDLGISTVWDWGIPKPTLDDFSVSFKGQAKLGYSVSASAEIEKTIDRELAKLNSKPVTFSVGTVPVVLLPSATLSLVGAARVQANISYSDEIIAGFEYGAKYQDKKWSPIKEYGIEPASPKDSCFGWGTMAAAASFEDSIGPEIAGDVKIYGVVGPEVAVTIKGETEGKIEVDSGGNGVLSTTNAIVFGADLKVNAKIRVLGFTIGAEWTLIGIEAKVELAVKDPFSVPKCSDNGGSSNIQVRLSGTVFDATTGDRIANANVSITDGKSVHHAVTANAAGEYSATVTGGDIGISVTANGYIDYEDQIDTGTKTAITADIQMSPRLEATQYRAVLTWAESPTDLDSHLAGFSSSGSYHVYFGDKNAIDPETGKLVANLDVDDTSSYGPETTTFDVASDGTYNFFVHNFSGSTGGTLANSAARVDLYRGNERVGTYNVPAGGDELYWGVFQIANGQLRIINKLADNPSYLFDEGASSMMRSAEQPMARLLTNAVADIEAHTKG
ncbi:hypothetical protein [Changpingibacter yushuensis]|uniref:hypothetical protein n=1 Tax=Changpingibacter yushuensis TaxID=2758440 RepID=UPI0015F5B55F|nr:hypothetical protein [Changpingibacter yushuensis]